MNKPRCGSCPWFEPENGNAGKCLVDPPIAHIVPVPDPVRPGAVRQMIQGLRPATTADDRCARHPDAQRLTMPALPARVVG